jgi:hypothetical protein
MERSGVEMFLVVAGRSGVEMFLVVAGRSGVKMFLVVAEQSVAWMRQVSEGEVATSVLAQEVSPALAGPRQEAESPSPAYYLPDVMLYFPSPAGGCCGDGH